MSSSSTTYKPLPALWLLYHQGPIAVITITISITWVLATGDNVPDIDSVIEAEVRPETRETETLLCASTSERLMAKEKATLAAPFIAAPRCSTPPPPPPPPPVQYAPPHPPVQYAPTPVQCGSTLDVSAAISEMMRPRSGHERPRGSSFNMTVDDSPRWMPLIHS
ncbi:hypothetical protein NHX12_029608 [Muraenolepis orangiensis]|uniref:Uncharacterized protein n=1 Tax=Muraenolepis orangiensis TaxID=630683 RepID=A0A9Q0E9Q5_9TELE|nr:hypothetical protein NHX12_029608 [Muraenolepis orangiensis]